MKKYVAQPGDKPFLLDPAKIYAMQGIPIKPVDLDGSEAQLKELLQAPADEPSSLVMTKHARTGETLIALEDAGTVGTGLATLLIGHDRPFFGRVILISRPGHSDRFMIAERVAFLVDDSVLTSSLSSGKRRWRPQPAFKFGSNAADILEFLNS